MNLEHSVFLLQYKYLDRMNKIYSNPSRREGFTMRNVKASFAVKASVDRTERI